MNNQEALGLHHTANSIMGAKKLPVKLAWALMRNIKRIESNTIEPLRKIMEPSSEFQKYEEKRKALCEKTALKDDKGDFVLKEGSYTFKDGDEPDFTELQAEYKTTIEERDQQVKDYNAMLLEPYEGDIYKVNIEHLPSEISPSALAILDPILEE